jgi:thiol-disulfide isomerase/thioredoxin
MKKCLAGLIPVLMLTCLACHQPAPDHYTITGDISGLKDSTIYLTVTGDSTKTDSTVVRNGHFAFQGRTPEPAMAYLETKERYAELFIENADIHVSGSVDSMDKLKVTGSVTQSEYEAMQSSLKDITDRQEALYGQYDSANKKKDSVAIAGLDVQIDTVRKQKRERIKTYIAAHPNSPVSLYEISSMSVTGEYPELEPLFLEMDTSQQNSVAGKKLATRLAVLKKSSLGEPVIDFTQKDLGDRQVTFSNYRKGKYVLLDFWASWCGPCRAENPNVLKAYKRFNSKNFSVLGVSLDNDSTKWKQAVLKDGMPWTQVSDLKGWKNEVAQQYGIQAIPFNFLVDTNGIIIARDLRGTALEKKLAEVLQ